MFGPRARISPSDAIITSTPGKIFPTVPILTHLVRRHPQALAPLHRALTRLLPVPGWCFLNLLTFRKA